MNAIYMLIALGFALNVKKLSIESASHAICSVLTILNGLVVLFYPIWLLLKLRKGWKLTLKEDKKEIDHAGNGDLSVIFD